MFTNSVLLLLCRTHLHLVSEMQVSSQAYFCKICKDIQAIW